MSGKPLDCDELVELVTAYLDDALSGGDRERFDEHLVECDGCENYLQQFRATVSTVGAIPADSLDPGFREQLMGAFRDWR